MPARQLDESRVEAFLRGYRNRELVRLLTCGSVDDGKSTLIGRLLYDARAVFEDQLAEARSRSRRASVLDQTIDLSLLLDGLDAEREQGITIDVAYRYFTTERRKFIIADTPGHAQYTRNMATGASRADLAVILVDATRGVREQTRRHAFLAGLFGIKHLVVAVNKMDLVGYDQAVFERLRLDCLDMLVKLGVRDVHWIPVSALLGDNVVHRSEHMPWYAGMALLEHLETVHIASDVNLIDTRFSVEYVVRTAAGFRGYAGSVVSGILRPGDTVVALPSGRRSRVRSVVGWSGDLAEAFAPMAVTVTLADEVDVARGDVLAPQNNAPRVDRAIEAMLVWMDATAMVPGAEYLLRQLARHTPARVTALRYRVNLGTLHREPAERLELNEIGRVALEAATPLAFDPYTENRATGAFVLIDRTTNATVAAGTIVARQPAPLAPAQDPAATPRVPQAGPGFTVWLTGLPDTNRTAVAQGLAAALRQRGCPALLLDEADLRTGLWADLGTPLRDPGQAVWRVAQVCRHAMASGLVAIVAVTAPGAATAAWQVVGADRWHEVQFAAHPTPGPAPESGASASELPVAEVVLLPGGLVDVRGCVQMLLQSLLVRGFLAGPPRP